jgi:hypothetical protein
MIDRGRNAAVAQRLERLHEIGRSVNGRDDDVHRIEERVRAGDLMVADEYLQDLESGRALPAPRPPDVDFTAFYPGAVASMERRGLDAKTMVVLESGGSWGEFHFGGVAEGQRAEALAALSAWLTLQHESQTLSNPRTHEPDLRSILQGIGLETTEDFDFYPEGLKGTRRLWVEARGVRPTGKAMVSELGSLAGGIYGLLLLWG